MGLGVVKVKMKSLSLSIGPENSNNQKIDTNTLYTAATEPVQSYNFYLCISVLYISITS